MRCFDGEDGRRRRFGGRRTRGGRRVDLSCYLCGGGGGYGVI